MNAQRHAEARGVDIEVDERGGEIHARICDNGKGFAPDTAEAAYQEGHLGLATIRERVKLTGGFFRIGPGDDGGTELVVSVPFEPRGDPFEPPPKPPRRRLVPRGGR